MAISKQRMKKLERVIQESITTIVPIGALIHAETEEERQKYIKILKENPDRGKPIGYEKYVGAEFDL